MMKRTRLPITKRVIVDYGEFREPGADEASAARKRTEIVARPAAARNDRRQLDMRQMGRLPLPHSKAILCAAHALVPGDYPAFRTYNLPGCRHLFFQQLEGVHPGILS